MRAQRRTRMLIFGTVGAVAVALTLVVYAGHVLRSLEDKTVDTRFVVRGSQARRPTWRSSRSTTSRSTTCARTPAQWPFPRCLHARVIDQIAKAAPEGDRGRHPVHRADRRRRATACCDKKLIEAVGRSRQRRARDDRGGRERPHGASSAATACSSSSARGRATRSSLTTATASCATCRTRPRS